MIIWRSFVLIIGLVLLWQLVVVLFHLPPYLLPGPRLVLDAFRNYGYVILQQTWPTLLETLLGLLFGSAIGVLGAVSMALFSPVRFWMMPVLVVSQAIPTFAIAPLLVVWFGYGMASKMVTTMIMLFFPVTSAFYDGLRRTPLAWLDMAALMSASRFRTLWLLQIPAALPALASGLRVATAFAPIGAVVGEWVGSSRGLGYLMLNANARMQIDLMFACLIVIIIMSLLLYFVVDHLLKIAIPWQVEK